MAPKRILIVDNDAVRGLSTRSTLQLLGYEIVLAANGLTALETAVNTPPDLVFCDADMPGMDGFTFVRHLRESSDLGAVPAFMMFENETPEGRLKALQAGADHCFTRPVAWNEVEARIQRIFDAHTRVLERAVAVKPLPPVRRRSTTGFGGKLAQLSLPSVLSMLEMERRNGELRVVDDQSLPVGHIVFRNGHVVAADCGVADLVADAEAVFRLLDATDGRFEFREMDGTTGARVSLRVQELLLEHARRSDEREKA